MNWAAEGVLSENSIRIVNCGAKKNTNSNSWVRISVGQGFGVSFKPRDNRLFDGLSRDLGWDIPGVPEKFEKK